MSKFDSVDLSSVLYLDAGNTSIKAAYRKGDSWKSLRNERISKGSDLIDWIKDHKSDFDSVILSSVRMDVNRLIEERLDPMNVLKITIDDFPDDWMDYQTPETLGVDRILGCLGAQTHSTRHIVVIDAGSACTIDFMDKNGVFEGGVIAPGVSSFMDILSSKAPALPKVEHEIPAKFPGIRTRECLMWGQTGFYVDGVEAVLKRFHSLYGSYDLFLTGGNASWLSDKLTLPSQIKPFLVFEGIEQLVRHHQSAGF